jgi:hypothetical protein
MAIRTLSDLVSNITNFAWRTGDVEFETAVPTFIALAEERFNRELRVRWMEASATIAVTDGEGDLPEDYLAYRNVYAGPCKLESVEPTWFTQTGCTIGPYFSVSGAKIKVHAPGTVVLDYYQRIPALGGDNQTNWLLDRYPSLYLYGALFESAPFMADDTRANTWGTFFDKAMDGLVSEDGGAKYANVQARVSGPTP